MTSYRIYFLNSQRRISAAHWFDADDDQAALWIGERLYRACSDVCASFEIWQLGRVVKGGTDVPLSAEPTDAILRRRQEMLVQHEETLRDSGGLIAMSLRLINSIEQAKRLSRCVS
jgi:hypothetical protein